MRCLGIFLLVFAGCASAQSLGRAPTIGTFGNWKVVRSVDQMTDKASCTGLLQKGAELGTVQLASNSLFIKIGGGLESLTLRFDEEKPRAMRLATKTEKQIRAFDLENEEFNAALLSKRLRYDVLTLVSGVAQDSLDISGIKEAHDALVACAAPSKP